jgi:PAS domain S-box-containing protein
LTRSLLKSYGVVILIMLAAGLITALLQPILTYHPTLLFILLAVVLSARYGGLGPGLFATFLSVLLNSYFFLQRAHPSFLFSAGNWLWLVLTAVAGIFISILGEQLHSSRQRAENKQRELEEEIDRRWRVEAEYHSLTDAMPQMVYTTRPDGRVDYVNQRWCDYTGLTVAQSLGDSWAAALHPEDAERTLTQWSDCVHAGITYENEYRCKGADGSYRWHLSRALPIRDKEGHIIKWIGTSTDIDDHKRAEEAQLFLAKIVEYSNDAIMGFTLDRRIVSWNPAAERIFGYSAAEVGGRDVAMLAPPDRRHEPVDAFAVLNRGDSVSPLETVRVRKDGVLIDVSITASPIKNAQGRVIGVSAIVRDITERKRMQKALQQEQERVQHYLDIAEVILVSLDKNGVIQLINRKGCQVLGYQEQELLGENWFQLCLPERDRPGVLAYFSRLIAGESALLEYYENAVLTRDGSERLIAWHNVCLTDARGAISGTLSSGEDITERRRAEDALRESEARYSTLAAAVPAILLTARPDGSTDYASQAFYDYSGLPPGAVDDRCWATIIHPDDAECSITRWQEAVTTGQPYNIECRLRRADGVYRWFKGQGIPQRDASGQIVKWFGAAIDIDDQKRAEALLKEADGRKDEFLAMLAHELRNPLAPIRNAVQILRLLGPAEPRLQWARDVIDRQVEHLTRLVDDLLDVSRITQGKITLHRELVELATIVERALETSRPLLEARKQQLTVTLPPAPIRLEGDLIRLAQVVSNLLNNAAKYTDEGGHIWLTAKQVDGEVILRVRDTGIGIAPEVLPHIFDFFTSINHAPVAAPGSLGIGLMLARRLIELHGGKVEAFSAGPGQGSEFVVQLPLPGEVLAETISTDEQAEQAPPGSCRRILVVDDNEDIAESMAMLLRLAGHEVHRVLDGQAALKVARTFQPQVVLLDIRLPGMNGYEVARQLRALAETRHAILIALTGYGQAEDQRRSKEAGFDHHLVKPVDLHRLETLLAGGTHDVTEPAY